MQVNPIRNNINSDLTAVQASQVQRAQEAKRPAHDKPVEAAEQSSRFYQAPDEYSHQEPEEASGRYWLEPSEDGPQLKYSAPEEAEPKASAAPKAPKDEPEKETSNVTTMDTGDVDREIEQLRKKVEDLKAQADKAEGPEAEKLERQLRQAQSELQKKDNDSYRRSHAKVS